MKRTLVVFALIALFITTPVVLAGCSGVAPTRDELIGRWVLTQTRYSPGTTQVPGDSLWTNTDYHIEFFADGTFVEVNFWNPNFVATGTWYLDGRDLIMTLSGVDAGDWVFVRNREVTISGGVLSMSYTRTQLGFTGTMQTWQYTHTFAKK